MEPGFYPTAVFTQLKVLEFSAGNLEIILNVYSSDPIPNSSASSLLSLLPLLSWLASSHAYFFFFLSLLIFSNLYT